MAWRILVLKYLFLFITGSLLGWGIEVFWRRYTEEKRWINPGFLSGPYLPLYGFGTCVLYVVSEMAVPFWGKVLLFVFSTTLLEYAAGEIFINYYKLRLWDYSNRFLNLRGIICPLYSFLWGILSLAFYFGLYPLFRGRVDFLLSNLEFSFFVGLFYGILVVDLINTLNLAAQMRRIVLDSGNRIRVDYERIKLELRERLVGQKLKVPFFQPFRQRHTRHFRLTILAHQERPRLVGFWKKQPQQAEDKTQ